MRKYVISLVFLTSFLIISLQTGGQVNSQVQADWQTIDKLLEEKLPESALEKLDGLKQQLGVTIDNQELIKIKLYEYRILMEKDPDELVFVLNDLENFIENLGTSAEKQLLWCMLADLYLAHYQNNSYVIDQRTRMEEGLPQDINTWTQKQYQTKITDILSKSLENQAISKNTDILTLKTLISVEDSALIYTPTLFDFIVEKNIQAALVFHDHDFIQSSYRQWIDFRKEQKDDALTLLTELDFVTYQEKQKMNDTYLRQLDSLERFYIHSPVIVELWAKKASYYLDHPEIELNRKIAHEIAQYGIDTYPDYRRIGLLKNIVLDIETQHILVWNADAVKAGENIKIDLETTNIEEVTIELYKLNTSATFFQEQQLNKHIRQNDHPWDKTLISTEKIKITASDNFDKVKTQHQFAAADYGIYQYVIYPSGSRDKDKKAQAFFTITDFSFIKRAIAEDKVAYYVVDRMSGKPVKNAEIIIYEFKWKENRYELSLISEATSNSKGYAELEKIKSYGSEIVCIKKGKDAYFASRSYSPYFYNTVVNDGQAGIISLWTDRSIYRPGQTVYFKAIGYQLNSENQAVIPNLKIKLDLIDNNRQTLQTIYLTTNEFGSVAGEFVLPSDGLNGCYQIRANDKQSAEFLVEAYKRPSFEVLVNKPEQEISFGEQIQISGEIKALSGYNLPHVPLQYTIKRHIHPLWRWFLPIGDGEIVASGEGSTDANGKFTLQFVPEKDKSISELKHKQAYQYTVTVEATDTKGETQAGSARFSVGEQSLFIRTNLLQMVDKANVQNINIALETIMGKKIDKRVLFQVFSLKDTDEYSENILIDTVYQTHQKLMEAYHHTESGNLKMDFRKFASGRYKLVVIAEDQHGEEVKHEQIFTLYSLKDKRPPVKTYAWLLQSNIEARVGEKVNIQFGTSAKSAYVLVDVMFGNQVLSSKWVKISNRTKNFNLLFKEAYRAGIDVNFTYVKDEKLIQRTVRISEKVEEKKLTPTLSVFRDRLFPGEEAQWTIHIPELVKLDQSAELLTGMYDASLDLIKPHTWYFNPVYRRTISAGMKWFSENKQGQYDQMSYTEKRENIPEWIKPVFNWHGLNLFKMRMIRIAGGAKMNVANDVTFDEVEVDVPLFTKSTTQYVHEKKASQLPADVRDDEQPVVRENFNETAFFYPQLLNDSLGNYQFSFTMPESLTRWNLKMLAHTKDLYFGQNEAQILTQQDLMVQLNIPRFVRQSDKIKLKASLVNLSENDLQATVSLQFINPKNNQIVLLNDTGAVRVELPKDGQPQSIAWDVAGFEGFDLLICKVVAQSGKFSDGEQHYLMVLSDKVLVTESFPFYVRDEKDVHLDLDKINRLADQTDTHQLSLEFSANPVWYAIQALPSLSEPLGENAVDNYIAWYVSTLTAKIIAENPKIQTIFEQIQMTDADTWQSALLKNQELKNILIEETPWLNAARNETERMQRMALLFDLNKQQYNRTQYWEKLSSLQLSNGAFTWFKGMNESRIITQWIAEGLVRAKAISNDGNINNMLKQAVQYLDAQLTKDYLTLKKSVKNYEQKMTVNAVQIQYLAIRSQLKQMDMNDDCTEAYSYYLSQIEKYHTQLGLYEKALAGKALHFEGKIKTVQAILQSLKENAIKSDEMGMYWAKNKAGYLWNERPITVHAQIMELFDLVGSHTADLAAMKIWLLRQKQTQSWDSPIASLHAIQALLDMGHNLLEHPVSYTITAGDKKFETDQAVAGLGYLKTNLTVADVSNGIDLHSTSRTDEGNDGSIAWGAVYWQHFQDMDQVESGGDFLQVKKQFYVQQIVNNIKTLVPLSAQKVKIGDKIVSRMVVTTDRNLEFVALKDKRSAALEPVNQLSGSVWRENVVYYRTTKDASTQYFFSFLPKGTYVFEDEYYVNSSGDFSGGIADIQCLYAPEFVGTSEGERLVIGGW